MIANPVLRSLFWIMGFVALIGNVATNILTLKEIVFHDKSNNSLPKGKNFANVANSCFIFNLSISNFLVGVYLLGVVSQGVIYSGHYCFDKEWRSSNRCWIFDTVAVLSSEAFAFIVASMPTFRLVSIYKPFLTRTMKFKWIVLVGVLCWLFALHFAFLPWLPLKSGYFVSEVWFLHNWHNFLRWPHHHSQSCFWHKFHTSILVQSQGNHFIQAQVQWNKSRVWVLFSTSVCMPRFYTFTSESSWKYSTFLIRQLLGR